MCAAPDRGDMLAQAGSLGEQLRTPVPRDLLTGRGPFTDVVLAGLGGSAAGGRLAVALLAADLRMPVSRRRRHRPAGLGGPPRSSS